ncbi:hypothetical protein P261_02791 [Lachnospiraceae bacterium TWA4]|nr:hypothetical protein P261_02791 [Lachnospiraceae bacterium TWA4]
MYYMSNLTEKVKMSYTDTSSHLYNLLDKKIYWDSICIYDEKRKIFINDAILKIYFLSDNDEKTEVTFLLHSSKKTQLLNVTKYPMSISEKEIYKLKANSEKVNLIKDEPKDFREESPNDSFVVDAKVELEKYRKALMEERNFLKHEGGRKYKATNGKLIASDKSEYLYIFDLETELYIADESPVKISVGNSITKGLVLMCEDFQIIVQVELNLGDRIANAFLSVEPWKLLDALENRLKNSIDIGSSEIAKQLIHQGPYMATTRPIEQIAKGQQMVIKKAMSNPICIVWGPPGTGKTYTMSELAIKFFDEGKNVLIVSHSNVSVDG